MRMQVFAIILIGLISGTCHSQGLQLIYEYPGESVFTTSEYQYDVHPGYYDLDGDGHDEIVIRDASGWPDSDEIVFIDGMSHQEIWSYSHASEISFGGCLDLDGEGAREVLIHTYGMTEIVSVPSGETVASYSGHGYPIVRDFNMNGFQEIMVKAATGVQVWEWNPTLTDVQEIAKPQGKLSQNHPNPFNPRTTIRYEVRSAGEVRLDILDLQGRLVRTLVNEHKPAGDQEVVWDGTDDLGRRQASGSYLYVLRAGGVGVSRKLVMLK